VVIQVLTAIVFSLMAWWVGTGLILWIVRRHPSHLKIYQALATVAWLMSLWLAQISMRELNEFNAYLGFASVIVMWGWHELSFLSGWLTGPRRTGMTPKASGWLRLREALASILWHELFLLGNLVLLAWMQSDGPNHLALYTFALLWCMRLSAKLNLFWGVPLLGEQYLPTSLSYLSTYFRVAPAGLGYMVLVTLSLGAWIWWVSQAGAVSATLSASGWWLLATLWALALVEHAMMILPWPMQRLWGWALGGLKRTSPSC
jgi:putative photosynthetic complex assembly protein 2